MKCITRRKMKMFSQARIRFAYLHYYLSVGSFNEDNEDWDHWDRGAALIGRGGWWWRRHLMSTMTMESRDDTLALLIN